MYCKKKLDEVYVSRERTTHRTHTIAEEESERERRVADRLSAWFIFFLVDVDHQ